MEAITLRSLPSHSVLVQRSTSLPSLPVGGLRSRCAGGGCSTSRCTRVWRTRPALACATPLAVDELGLVEADRGLGHGVVVGVAGSTDRRGDPGPGKTLCVAE